MKTGSFLHALFLETPSQQIHYSSINILKILKSKLNVLSNDQIHNNLYLTVENSIEIGKVYQVISSLRLLCVLRCLGGDE